MECVVCGGTNFTKESGFYFCSECQTQSQEVQEHAFQEEVSVAQIKDRKKVKDAAPSKVGHVTSWECYNVILVALAEELIKLGADNSIKKIVKCLWMKYLEKLEVLNMEQDQRPKLPLVHFKRDVSITYGLKKRKRSKKSSSEASVSDFSSRRERARKKTALAKSQYSEMSSKMDSSLSQHNETLTSLKTSSDKSDTTEQIVFNKYSLKELRSKMSKKHLEGHKLDLRADLACHKFKYRNLSNKFRNEVYYISPIRIYSILYISLLIAKDPIQLGDLFRFLREGHLNYDRFTSLFPESYSNKNLNIRNHNKRDLFSHKNFRETVSKMVKFLEVRKYIEGPNLVELAQRYCEELNLPVEILGAVNNIISRNPMTFGNDRNKFTMPNYEARIMSLIIFVLKLLYGLDGITEKHLTNYTQIVNKQFPGSKRFDLNNWMQFVNYRNLVVATYHYPTYSLNNPNINTDLFLQYKMAHNILADDRKRLVSDMVGYKNILTKLQSYQNDFITSVEYPVCLKPFSNYSQIILNLTNDDKIRSILEESFASASLDYLLNPMKFLMQINRKVDFKHGGANDNWVLEKTISIDKSNNYLIDKKDRKFVSVEVVQDSCIENKKKKPKNDIKPRDFKDIQNDFELYHKTQFKENLFYLINLYNKDLKRDRSAKNSSVINDFSYDLHFNPYERYWIYFRDRINLVKRDKFCEHFGKLSDSFKFILNECARVIEQSNQELLGEFHNTELYLVYCGSYKNARKRRKLCGLKHNIRQAEANW